MNKSILEVVHETALGLHEAGAMKQKTLREIESLCLSPVKKYSANQIKLIRLKNEVSQSVFAAYLNASPSTVQKWESGENKPNRAFLKLLGLVEQKGLDVLT
jgi:putative transcriptional regulator